MDAESSVNVQPKNPTTGVEVRMQTLQSLCCMDAGAPAQLLYSREGQKPAMYTWFQGPGAQTPQAPAQQGDARQARCRCSQWGEAPAKGRLLSGGGGVCVGLRMAGLRQIDPGWLGPLRLQALVQGGLSGLARAWQ